MRMRLHHRDRSFRHDSLRQRLCLLQFCYRLCDEFILVRNKQERLALLGSLSVSQPCLNCADVHRTPALSASAPNSISDCKRMSIACSGLCGDSPGPSSNPTTIPTLGTSSLVQ